VGIDNKRGAERKERIKIGLNMSQKKQGTWYHGSSLKLETLRKGSSITQIEKLAQAFSSQPSIISAYDDGKIKHNGKSKGRVYRVADEVNVDDIYEHPRSSMEKGWEYITKKEFKLELLYEYEVTHYPEDILSEDEIRKLRDEHNIPH
jgi:predicted transcriptional regulator